MRAKSSWLLAAMLVGGTCVSCSKQDQRYEVAADSLAPETQSHDHFRRTLSASDASSAAEARLLPPDVIALLEVTRPLRHGDFVWHDLADKNGKVEVWVDLRRQMVSVFRDRQEIGTAVIVYGAPGMGTPLGRFEVLRKVADYHSQSYDAPMPYSLFLTQDGVALHASPVSATRATHGCVGLPPEFARQLYAVVGEGDVVTIVLSRT